MEEISTIYLGDRLDVGHSFVDFSVIEVSIGDLQIMFV